MESSRRFITHKRHGRVQTKRPRKSDVPDTPQSLESSNPATPKNQQKITTQPNTFLALKRKWLVRRIANRFRNLIVVKDAPKDINLFEEWQSSNQENTRHSQPLRHLLKSSSRQYFILSLMLGFSYCCLLWYISVKLVYGVPSQYYAYIIWLLVLILDTVVQLNTGKSENAELGHSRTSIFKDYLRESSYKHIFSIGFLLCNLTYVETAMPYLEAVQLIILFLEVRTKLAVIKPFLDLRKEIVLIESFLLLLVIAHIFALILFQSSKADPEDNWVLEAKIQNRAWTTQYIYSLYWAITTIVTVGYGDITPQNEYEILVTICIEVVGAAVFGYIINIIGVTMAQLKKQDENLNEQLGIANKLVECLNLKDDLAYRLRRFLQDNQKADTSFTLKDEKRILDKLKPALRNQILQQTNTKIIKKSLFFLTTFTKNLQDYISLKLIKRVLQPNQVLASEQDQAKLFVIDHGKVEVYYLFRHHQKYISKTLRTIEESREQEKIGCNVYGWCEMILGKKLALKAVSYELNEADFQQGLRQHPLDFQKICQVRDTISLVEKPECFEGASLIDPKIHYIPLRTLIVQRYVKSNIQRRRQYIHREQLKRIKALANIHVSNIQELIEKASRNQRYSSLLNILHKNKTSSFRESGFSNPKKDEYSDDDTDKQESFECIKQYTKYFDSWNVSEVAKRYNLIEKCKDKANFICNVVGSVFIDSFTHDQN